MAGEKLFAVFHCTLGGFLITLASLALDPALAGHGDWPARRFMAVGALTMDLASLCSMPCSS
jgi:hypothetical protein